MTNGMHPGVRLKEELDKHGWSQSDLVYVLGCGAKTVNLIINGKQGISPTMSKALGEVFDLPSNHFADLQMSFELAGVEEPDPNLIFRARMMRNYPVREMVRRDWVPSNPEDLNEEIATFFGVSDPDSIPFISHSAKKPSYEGSDVPPPQLAWLFRVRRVAKAMSVSKYSEAKLKSAVGELQKLLVAPEEARHVPRILNECGVRFVIVEALPKAQIDGVCLWLSRDEPVIGLSLRRDQIDNFWFVLRHEIEHVLRKHGQNAEIGMVDLDLHGESAGLGNALPEEERVANSAAADFCVPAAKMESFLKRKKPFYNERDVVAFSKVNHIHPGLAVGQIQFATGRYDYLNNLQSKIRKFIIPNAIVDGFKQSVPID